MANLGSLLKNCKQPSYLSSPLWLAVVHEAEAAAVGQLHLGQELLRAHRGHCHGEAGSSVNVCKCNNNTLTYTDLH